MGDRISNNSSSSVGNKLGYSETQSPLEQYRQTDRFKQDLSKHNNKLIEEGLGKYINKDADSSNPPNKK